MAGIILTNKSSRVYVTSKGNFHPGTSKEFDEKEAVGLLGYSGEILRAEKVLGGEYAKTVEAKDTEIERLQKEIEAKDKKLTEIMDRGKDKKAKA